MLDHHAYTVAEGDRWSREEERERMGRFLEPIGKREEKTMSENNNGGPVLLHVKTVDGKPLTEEEIVALQGFLAEQMTNKAAPSEFARAIRTLRLFLGLGMREFAERCLFRPSIYAAFEQGLSQDFGSSHLLSQDIGRIVVEMAKAAIAKAERAAT